MKPVFNGDKENKIDPILNIIGAMLPKPLLKVLRSLSDVEKINKIIAYEKKFPETIILQVKDDVRSFPIR